MKPIKMTPLLMARIAIVMAVVVSIFIVVSASATYLLMAII